MSPQGLRALGGAVIGMCAFYGLLWSCVLRWL